MPKVSRNIKAEKQISNFLISIKTISLPWSGVLSLRILKTELEKVWQGTSREG